MSIAFKKRSGDFEPCPEYNGPAVCVDVTPLQEVVTQWGKQEKFRVVFEIDQNREDGSRWCVWSTGFTPSFHEKAAWRKFVRQWFGRDLSEEEMDKFDSESLVGKPAYLVVVHNTKDEKVFANIASCTPNRGTPLQPSGKYIRKQDRKEKEKEKDAGYRPTQKPEGAEAVEDWTKTRVHVGTHMGSELRELSPEQIQRIIEKWLPTAKANPKPSADDRRLMAALEEFQKSQGQQEPDDIPF